MTETIDVIGIVDAYLREHGYDGLCNEAGGCACEIGDLVPCGHIDGDCEAGHRVDGHPECGEGCVNHIVPGKREEVAK